MKVIDLLNKIAKKEEVPKKIKYRDWLYEFEKDCNDYLCQYDSLLYRENDDLREFLNEKVEILEESKGIPEKLEEIANGDFLELPSTHDIMNKINEILDYLDYLESKGE